MTAGGREFQVAGSFADVNVRLNDTSRDGTANDRSDRKTLTLDVQSSTV